MGPAGAESRIPLFEIAGFEKQCFHCLVGEGEKQRSESSSRPVFRRRETSIRGAGDDRTNDGGRNPP
jgi:hypothetical protein